MKGGAQLDARPPAASATVAPATPAITKDEFDNVWGSDKKMLTKMYKIPELS